MSEFVPSPEELKKLARLAKKNLKRERQGKPPIVEKPDGMTRKAWKNMGKSFPETH